MMVFMAPGKPSRRSRLWAWWMRRRGRWPKGYQQCGFIIKDRGE